MSAQDASLPPNKAMHLTALHAAGDRHDVRRTWTFTNTPSVYTRPSPTRRVQTELKSLRIAATNVMKWRLGYQRPWC